MVRCANCNIEYTDDLEKCPSCGERNPMKELICPHCGNSYEQDDKFCGSCGQTLEPHETTLAPPVCEKCGAPLKANAVFCVECGHKVNQLEEEMIATPTEPVVSPTVPDKTTPLFQNTGEFQDLKEAVKAPKKKKNKGKWVLLIVFLLVLAAVIFVWTKMLPSSLNAKPPKASSGIESSTETSIPSIPKETSKSDSSFETSKPTIKEKTEYRYTTKEAVEPAWENVGNYDEKGLAQVVQDGKVGLINKEGEYVVEPRYESIGDFGNSEYTVISENEKFGYIDVTGKVVVEPTYDSATNMMDTGISGKSLGGVVGKDGKYGFVTIGTADGSSPVVSELKYDFATPYSGGHAAVSLDGKYYFIDAEDKKVSGDYEGAGRFSEGLAPVKQKGKWGYIDNSFKEIIPPTYDKADSFENGLAIVTMANKQYFIDEIGEEKSPKVDMIWPMSEGLATVQLDGVYGYIDGKSTDYVITPQYVDAYAYSEGLCAVSTNAGVWFYVDKDNKPAFTKSFDEAYSFKNGLACVKMGLDYTLIDTKGEQAIAETWNGLGTYAQGKVAVKENGQWGFVEVKEK